MANYLFSVSTSYTHKLGLTRKSARGSMGCAPPLLNDAFPKGLEGRRVTGSARPATASAVNAFLVSILKTVKARWDIYAAPAVKHARVAHGGARRDPWR